MGQQIADYALVGDLRTAALISATGSIDWLCLPQFDSPALCAALLGEERHGHWQLAPVSGGRCTSRRYRPDTLVLDTDWATPHGVVRVTDFMAVGGTPSRLIRVVQGLTGEVRMRMTCCPRMQYGQVRPAVNAFGQHACISAGGESLWLHATVDLDARAGACEAQFSISAGETVSFTLTSAPAAPGPPGRGPQDWRILTERFWTEWIGRCTYEGRWSEQVRRSLIVLKALTHAPSGGIVAAATTSLPERVGGSRNWDYRFCWLRDAAFALEAFLLAGYTEEAAAWRDWLLHAGAEDPDEVTLMYSIDGGRCPPEEVLDWLPGHDGSVPVRIGNEAATQHQNDVWGEVLAILGAAHAAGVPRVPGEEQLENALLARLLERWRRPDHGIWEVRGPRRHFVHSKLMCWVGVSQAIRNLEGRKVAPLDELNDLRGLCAAIHSDICERGFDAEMSSFTQAYGSPRMDAAVLLLPRYGFLPYSDPRVAGTVKAVRRELSHNGLVSRYAVSDGLGNADGVPGDEGAFLACSFWLVDALHGLGETSEATELFDRLMSLSNDVGLLSEECDPQSGQHLGNTPQAFSHAGVVATAFRLGRDAIGARRPRLPVREEAAS